MRYFLFGVAGALALGLGALGVSAPAQAQSVTITVGEPYGHNPRPRPYYPGPRPIYQPYYGPKPLYHPYRPAYRRVVRRTYTRPVYVAGPRCTIRTTRYWDGYSWVIREQRVCR